MYVLQTKTLPTNMAADFLTPAKMCTVFDCRCQISVAHVFLVAIQLCVLLLLLNGWLCASRIDIGTLQNVKNNKFYDEIYPFLIIWFLIGFFSKLTRCGTLHTRNWMYVCHWISLYTRYCCGYIGWGVSRAGMFVAKWIS